MLDILDRMHQLYPTMGAEYRAGEHRWYFPSGAKVHLGHMADKDSHYQYQGKEFHDVRFDEAGQFLPKQLSYLFSRCRTTIPMIPKRIRYASNPGGPGHQYLKDRFKIGQYPDGYRTFKEEIRLKLPNGQKIHEIINRVFIPGRIWDNPSIIKNDPGYLAFLDQLPEIERLRLMEGRWDAFEGQKFQELNKQVHGYDFACPPEWETFGAFDWGYARPWAYLIFKVDFNGKFYVDDMFYGNNPKMAPNIGMRMTDSEIARKIKEIEKNHRVKYRVAGPDIWGKKPKRDGTIGPSPVENMYAEGIGFVRADNNRIIGWQQIHHRLALDEDGNPHLYIRRSLEDLWRTMALMQEDPENPEDIINKDIEDHLPECLRYGVMTRPMLPKHPTKSDRGSFQAERRKLIAAKNYAARHGVPLSQAYGKV